MREVSNGLPATLMKVVSNRLPAQSKQLSHKLPATWWERCPTDYQRSQNSCPISYQQPDERGVQKMTSNLKREGSKRLPAQTKQLSKRLPAQTKQLSKILPAQTKQLPKRIPTQTKLTSRLTKMTAPRLPRDRTINNIGPVTGCHFVLPY